MLGWTKLCCFVTISPLPTMFSKAVFPTYCLKASFCKTQTGCKGLLKTFQKKGEKRSSYLRMANTICSLIHNFITLSPGTDLQNS